MKPLQLIFLFWAMFIMQPSSAQTLHAHDFQDSISLSQQGEVCALRLSFLETDEMNDIKLPDKILAEIFEMIQNKLRFPTWNGTSEFKSFSVVSISKNCPKGIVAQNDTERVIIDGHLIIKDSTGTVVTVPDGPESISDYRTSYNFAKEYRHIFEENASNKEWLKKGLFFLHGKVRFRIKFH